jgi:hypothetical protein
MNTQERTIEVARDGTVFVETTTYLAAGNPTIERRSFTPGSDVSSQPELVQQACQVAWTEAVVAEFERRRNEALNAPLHTLL